MNQTPAPAPLSASSEAHGSPSSRGERESLWDRLRSSMDRLDTIGQRSADPAAISAKLAARAKRLRAGTTSSAPSEAPLVFVAFQKGSQRFGVLVEHVIEIQSLDSFMPVPGTPAFIPGVIHWRGEVLSLLDMGKLIGIPESGLADVHVCLLVEAGSRRVAVVASEIEEIYAVQSSELKRVPGLPNSLPAEWLLGVHDNNRMILDLKEVLCDTRLTQWRMRAFDSRV